MKEGYKRYEFGYIPNEWNVKRIGEIYKDLKAGATPSRSNPEYFNGDIPWITSGELKSKFIYNTYEKISKEGLESANLRIYPKGTFFIAITGLEAEGTRGSCGINAIDSATNQSCLAFRKVKEVNTEYLYYWYLLYGDFIGLRYTQGTKQQSLNNKIVEGLEFAYPTLKEQEKIADILSTVDSQIEDTDKLIEKTKVLKKGLMQRLLTKGIGHTEFKKTEVGEIPVEWKLKTLRNITDVRDGTHDSPKYVEHGIPFITSKNLKEHGIDFSDVNYISNEDHEKFSQRSNVSNGDILFGMIGTIGNPIIVKKEFEFSIKNVALIKFNNNSINNVFLLNILKSNIIEKQFEKLSNGGVQKFIALGMIRNLLIPIPSVEEQQEISNIISSIDNKIKVYENKKIKLEELKKGLMQQLLAGNIRVN